MTAEAMSTEMVLEEFRRHEALLEGHFKLSSGKHSSVYLQCARLLQKPPVAERLCCALAHKLRAAGADADLVVSPAMGGVIVGYEMGRQLGLDAIFAEREGGRLTLRRGFSIPAGAQVLMVEDVVTTGLSSRECIACITAAGGTCVAAAALVDRSGGRADVGVPLIALATIDAPLYDPDQLPPDLAERPAVKPGSREMVR